MAEEQGNRNNKDFKGYKPSGGRPGSGPARKPYSGKQGKPSFGDKRGSFGRPALAGPGTQGDKRGPYGRPAPSNPQAQGDDRGSLGRPTPVKPGTDGNKRGSFGRPAKSNRDTDGDKRSSFGRPAKSNRDTDGDKRGSFGRPAKSNRNTDDDKRGPYGRPAPSIPQIEGDKRGPYGRPATSAPKFDGKKSGDFARAVPKDQASENDKRGQYGRPAPAKSGFNGDKRGSFARPAQSKLGSGGDKRGAFGRPGSGRPGAQGEGKPNGRFPRGAPHGAPGGRPFAPARPSPFARPAVPAEPLDPLSGSARGAAWDVLNRILLEDGYTSLSLGEELDKVRMSPRDKRLCTNIVYTTVENLINLDYALDTCIERTDTTDKSIRNLLRLSASQVFFMDRVPESAVVNEAVKLTRLRGFEPLTGFVNGVLRSLLRTKDSISWPKREENVVRFLSVTYSYPESLVEKFISVYGEERAESIMKGGDKHRYITVRPNMMLLQDEAFEELLGKKEWRVERGTLPHAWYVSGAGNITEDPDYLAGLFSLQGESSMLAAEAVKVKLGMNVLDACAAPGGKTAYMAEKMQGTGRVQAWDVHEHRVRLLQGMANRLKLYNVRPMVRDALIPREQMVETMDAVLLDAPCSGSGVIADKPDLKYHITPESLVSVSQMQKEMLDICSQYVKKGGVLVYSTCSILPEENALQVEAFLQRHPEFTIDALPEGIPQSFRDKSGPFGLQLLPGEDKVEGFFIARMLRSRDA